VWNAQQAIPGCRFSTQGFGPMSPRCKSRKFRINKVSSATKVPCLPVSLRLKREVNGDRRLRGADGRSVCPEYDQSMSGPPVAPLSTGARFECPVDFIESYLRRLETLGTPSLAEISLLSLAPSPGWGRAHSRLIETRPRELPHPNLPAQSEWVPCRIAFAPPAEGRKRGVRGKRGAPRLEHPSRQLLPVARRLILPAGQKEGTVKPSLTLFWLILTRHQQAP
jgi:hypothetical protein